MDSAGMGFWLVVLRTLLQSMNHHKSQITVRDGFGSTSIKVKSRVNLQKLSLV